MEVRRWTSVGARNGAAGWLLLAVSAGLSGCDMGGDTQGVSAAPMQHPLLENVPLPRGFALVEEQSVGRSTGALRIAKCTFSGGDNLTAVNRFFKEYMPTGGWKIVEERFEHGVYDMRYENPAEECNLRLKREKGKTFIIVDVGPKPTEKPTAEARGKRIHAEGAEP